MRYGVPSGVQWTLDIDRVQRLHDPDRLVRAGKTSAATGLVFTINGLAFIPMLGVGQAVTILVGKHLGEDRPELAERMTWLGLAVAGAYMGFIAFLYVARPSVFIVPFQGDNDPAEVGPDRGHGRCPALVRGRLLAVRRGEHRALVWHSAAPATRCLSRLVSLVLAWPVMVVPTWLAWKYDWGLYWAWAAATAYICLQALCFLVRFRGGKWKSMRVIEPAVVD